MNLNLANKIAQGNGNAGVLVADFVVDPNGMDRLSRAYAWGKGIAGSVGGLLSITTFADDGSTPTATYIPLYDDRGNVVGLANATDGKLVAVYQYDPFGKLITEAGDKAVLDANPFMFSTKYFDRETGLYDFGFRYYSPVLQRWLSRDPIAESGGVNVYAFCKSDPVNNIDPDGLETNKLAILSGQPSSDPATILDSPASGHPLLPFNSRGTAWLRGEGSGSRYAPTDYDAATVGWQATAANMTVAEFKRHKHILSLTPLARNPDNTLIGALKVGMISSADFMGVISYAQGRHESPAENALWDSDHFVPDPTPPMSETVYALFAYGASKVTLGITEDSGWISTNTIPDELKGLRDVVNFLVPNPYEASIGLLCAWISKGLSNLRAGSALSVERGMRVRSVNRAEQLSAGLPDAIKPGWIYADDAAVVGQRVVDDVLRRDFPTLRQTVPFRFDENFLSAGGAMRGRPYNRVGPRAFNSLQDLRDTLLEEELHRRWFKRGIVEDVHSNFELDVRFYQTIERYKKRRYWPRTEYQDAWLQRQQQLPK